MHGTEARFVARKADGKRNFEKSGTTREPPLFKKGSHGEIDIWAKAGYLDKTLTLAATSWYGVESFFK
ncbi:MAG: hypothetical protein BV459_06050 [Thermoplasmata archaeon M11B2D]|nr:MAG: hypothetical protein BV459_06050 [Thermoplasmata archaeon M11B2D]